MNHGKTLVIASIVVAGVLTGVASATLLQQVLAFRHHHVFVLGTPGSSVGGANGIKGGNGANGPSAPGLNGLSANGSNDTSANGSNGNNTNGANGYASWSGRP
jgi:hypothetical protein